MTLLACLFDPAKGNQRLPSSFLLSHASSNVELGLSCDVVAQLFIDFATACPDKAGAYATQYIPN
jgi:hypothetical protein